MNNNELWFSVIMMIGVLIFLKMIFTGVTTAIKAVYENRQHWGKNPNSVPPMFQKMADRAMADRDEVIEDLQDRVEVLEKIVTDQHNQSKARELAEEIDKLNS